MSLTLVPRMVDQPVVLDDGLPLANGAVPGEDPVALRVGRRISDGVPPLDALAAEGVRWVVVEKDSGFPDPVPAASLPATARVVHDGPAVRVLELATNGSATARRASGATVWGWAVTSLTWLAGLGCVVAARLRQRSG